MAMLTQLINTSGISIGLIGTPETTSLLETAFQLARRSLGLQYNALNNDEYFSGFCELLYKYQYVQKYTEITPQIIDWLYEHSGGVTSVVVSLIHDAQEIAILTAYETLDITMLNQGYDQMYFDIKAFFSPDDDPAGAFVLTPMRWGDDFAA
ncbi:MAG: hypothetical protein PUE72_09760 [Lachnospiraceae bacterium]|nr:hypothetical protein [Lachnospiraceae bacterium]